MAHGGEGVLFLYGNYAGDVLNFDVAAEMLTQGRDSGFDGAHLRRCSVGSSGQARRASRHRPGDFLVIKVASARAEERANLVEVTLAAEKASDNMRSMGVALTSCVIPASGRSIFEISDQEMEIGMGLHGEPGVRRSPMASADQVAEDMMNRILGDLRGWQGRRRSRGPDQRPRRYAAVGALHHVSRRPPLFGVTRCSWCGELTSVVLHPPSIWRVVPSPSCGWDPELKRLLSAPAASAGICSGRVEWTPASITPTSLR